MRNENRESRRRIDDDHFHPDIGIHHHPAAARLHSAQTISLPVVSLSAAVSADINSHNTVYEDNILHTCMMTWILHCSRAMISRVLRKISVWVKKIEGQFGDEQSQLNDSDTVIKHLVIFEQLIEHLYIWLAYLICICASSMRTANGVNGEESGHFRDRSIESDSAKEQDEIVLCIGKRLYDWSNRSDWLRQCKALSDVQWVC